jgi:hypothetical protein
MKRVLMAKTLGFLLLICLLSSCELELERLPIAPFVFSFSVDDDALVDNRGWIITESKSLTLEAVVETVEEMDFIEIEANARPLGTLASTTQRDTDFQSIHTCKGSKRCLYEWPVSEQENAVYSFRVTAKDSRGAASIVPYNYSLVIDRR